MAFNRDKALKQAEKLVGKGKDREAIATYEEILKHDPKDLSSVNKLGDLYLRAGEKSKAVGCFAKVADKYADDGFNLRAIAMYKKCTRVEPARIEFHERLADLNAQQGLVNEARAAYEYVAEHHAKAGRSKEAREQYEKIAKIDPDNLKIRLKLADLYLKEKQLNLALGEYQVIGSELAKKGMLEESKQVLDKALTLDPGNVEILRAMARVHADLGQPQQAVDFIKSKLQAGGAEPGLHVVLGEMLQAAGQTAEAQQALAKAAEMAPDQPEVARALFNLAVEQRDADAALKYHEPVARKLLAEGRSDEVIGDLRAILAFESSHAPSLKRLLEVQVEAGADEKVQADGLAKLAEAYIAQGQHAEAEKVLEKLTKLEPDASQHEEKLEFVRAKLAAGAPAAAQPAAAPEPAAQPAAQDVSLGDLGAGGEAADEWADDAGDDGGGFSMSFDDDELDAGGGADDERQEFVNEHLAEADVFIKYGLVDKAIDQLEQVIARHPDEIATRSKLKDLLVEEGRKDEAMAHAMAIVETLREQGDESGAAEALEQARAIDPSHASLAGAGAAAGGEADAEGSFELSLSDDDEPASQAEGAPDDGSADELSFDLSDGDEDAASSATSGGPAGFDLSGGDEDAAVPATSSAEDDDGFEIAVEDEDDEDEMEIAVDEDDDDDAEMDISMEDDDEGGESAGGFDLSIDDEPAAASESDAGSGSTAGAGGFDLSVDEPEPEPEAEPAAVEPEPVAAEAEPAAVEAEPAASSFELGGAAEGVAAEAASESSVAVEASPSEEEDEGLFGEEDDFFNLADELNRELESEEAVTEVSRESDEEMSLEDIVSGIQKGVAAQVEQEDYETHYNLGIAYKEMGLVDEAIGEFQYASKDPTKFLQCCILLGACFTEKGMPELAIKWYEKGRHAPDVTEEDDLALRYEIAVCREAIGDDKAALDEFTQVYGMNARYRDVGNRIGALKQKLGQ